MRLSKIKLSGFKSFVDTTTIKFPSNLMGIVGPNGCGKSNIIDAIRWVLGEASAKTLRGDSMVDVIFNGSANRKPVGLASIELTLEAVEADVLNVRLLAGADQAYVLAFPRFPQLSCARQPVLPRDAAVTPLVDTRAHLLLRRGAVRVEVEHDGVPRILPAGLP